MKSLNAEQILKYLFDQDRYLYSWRSYYFIKSFNFHDEIPLGCFFQKCNEKQIIDEYARKYNIVNYKGDLFVDIDCHGHLILYCNKIQIYKSDFPILYNMYYIPKVIEKLINDNSQVESISFNFKIKDLKIQLKSYYKHMIFNQNDTVIWFKEKFKHLI